MPELPGTLLQPPVFGMMLGQSDDGRLMITEVERAAKLLRDISKGKKVVEVDTRFTEAFFGKLAGVELRYPIEWYDDSRKNGADFLLEVLEESVGLCLQGGEEAL